MQGILENCTFRAADTKYIYIFVNNLTDKMCELV